MQNLLNLWLIRDQINDGFEDDFKLLDITSSSD
jgi:hypothetical protein